MNVPPSEPGKGVKRTAEDRRTEVERAIMRRRWSERKVMQGVIDRLTRGGEVNRETALRLAQDLVLAVDRADRKARLNAISDRDGRLLVGARISRREAERYRDQATAAGQSLYAWCCEAFKRHYMDFRTGVPNKPTPKQ